MFNKRIGHFEIWHDLHQIVSWREEYEKRFCSFVYNSAWYLSVHKLRVAGTYIS
jgi:hypothetical protein